MTAPTTLALPSALDRHRLPRWLASVTDGPVAVFLDYDGTLTPIVDRPEEATLDAAMRDRLARLAACCPVTIVTGRDISVVKEFVQLDQLGYAGCHGLDIEGPAGSGLRHEAAREMLSELDRAEAVLRQRLAGIPGALVERKRFGVSVHVRLAVADDAKQIDAVVGLVASTHPALRRESGKKVFELRPDLDWDKGTAVEWLLGEMALDRSAGLYIGDDLTDEHAFEVLAGRGMTIVVADADRPTAAEYRLGGPDDVLLLLERLIEVIGEPMSARATQNEPC